MKKLFSVFILALVCICSAWAQQDTIKVATADELYNALSKHGTNKNAVIKLTDDIDVSKYGGDKHLSMEFAATLDGYYTLVDSLGVVDPEPHGHEIKNLNEGYLLTKIKGGTVKGLRFVDCNTSEWMSFNSGVLCKEAHDAEITDVMVIGCEYKSKTWDAYTSKTGILASELYGCKLNNVNILACNLWYDGQTVGCIAGTAYETDFMDCNTDAFTSIYSDSEPNAYVAGLVGAAEKCNFDSCYNFAVVASCEMSDNLGGLTAESTNCKFTDCVNYGTVSQMSQIAMQSYRTSAFDYYDMAKYLYGTTNASLTSIHYSKTSYQMFDQSPERYLQLNPGKDAIKKLNSRNAYYSTLTTLTVVVMAIAIIQTIYDVAMFIYNQNAPDELGGITSVSYGCIYDR